MNHAQQSGSDDFRFGEFFLNPDRREVRKGDIVVRLDGEAFDVLLLLLGAEDQRATYDDLVAVLPGRSGARLTQAVRSIRRALDDTPGIPSVIVKTETGTYRLTTGSQRVAGPAQAALLPQPRPRPVAWVYASLLAAMLVLLGLAITLIPPL